MGALVVALSVGTLALLWMETIPAQPEVPLQAVNDGTPAPELARIHQTDVPLQYVKWRNVVVHDAGRDGPGIASRCHFLIGSAAQFGDGEIVPTRLWRLQRTGSHIHVPGFAFEDESIGVCLLADSRKAAPTPKQLEKLAQLVRGLQVSCQIGADRVYLHSELGEPGCPGAHFEAQAFRGQLVPAMR